MGPAGPIVERERKAGRASGGRSLENGTKAAPSQVLPQSIYPWTTDVDLICRGDDTAKDGAMTENTHACGQQDGALFRSPVGSRKINRWARCARRELRYGDRRGLFRSWESRALCEIRSRGWDNRLPYASRPRRQGIRVLNQEATDHYRHLGESAHPNGEASHSFHLQALRPRLSSRPFSQPQL